MINMKVPPDESMPDLTLIEYRDGYNSPVGFQNKAKAILLSREKNDAKIRHKESISETRKSNRIALWSIAIASIALIVAVIALSISYRQLQFEQSRQATESRMQPLTSSPTTSERPSNSREPKSKSSNPTNTKMKVNPK